MSNRSSKKKTAPEESKNNIFTVQKVLDKRAGKGGRDEFLIQWQGFTSAESSWEPRENLQCQTMLAEFEKEYQKRERPSRKRKASVGSDDGVDPNDKFSLNGKQLKCIIGLTKGPGELHFLCRFSDDTARLVPAKEVNTRYRPFVDEYGSFLQRTMDRKQKRAEEGKKKNQEDEEDEEWPRMPPGYKILSFEEQEIKMREKRAKMSQSPDINEAFQPTPTDILNDLQMCSDGDLLSSIPTDSNEEVGETTGMSDTSLFAVFDDSHESPRACPIVIDTVQDDDDSILFPGVVTNRLDS